MARNSIARRATAEPVVSCRSNTLAINLAERPRNALGTFGAACVIIGTVCLVVAACGTPSR
jgi:hypothetical protein